MYVQDCICNNDTGLTCLLHMIFSSVHLGSKQSLAVIAMIIMIRKMRMIRVMMINGVHIVQSLTMTVNARTTNIMVMMMTEDENDDDK